DIRAGKLKRIEREEFDNRERKWEAEYARLEAANPGLSEVALCAMTDERVGRTDRPFDAERALAAEERREERMQRAGNRRPVTGNPFAVRPHQGRDT
ncbi:hypothetical protein, partial [Nocardia thailandica]|uniref:hypothetical protein n=1 Tax=Nocardia thailandica TaxID=257275 RepID=UPI0005BBE252